MKKLFLVFLSLILPNALLLAQKLNSVVTVSQYKEKQVPVSMIYLNCGNPMYIKLGDHPIENVSFKATGAEIIEGASHGEMLVVPHSSNVVISIFDKDKLWATESFMVRVIPPPSIEIFVNDDTIQYDKKSAVPQLNKLQVKVMAEELFAQTAPADANYILTGMEVSLARGKTLVKALDSIKPEIDLSEMSKLMLSGDRIIIVIKGIQRINFKGEKENVNFGLQIFTIPIQ